MPIITRPDYTGDAIARLLTNASEEDALQHNKDKADRKKRQKTTAIAAGAIVGGAAGLAAGGAGAAAAGTAGQAGFAAGGSVATTLLPAANTIAAGSLGAGLAGAQLGAKVGGFIGDEDYAGAIQTGIGGVQGLLQNQANEKFFGGKVTKEGMAAYARQAEAAGSTIDALMGSGLPAGEALARAQDAQAGREFEGEVGGHLAKSAAEEVLRTEAAYSELAEIDEIISNMPGRERGVDHKAVTAIEEDLAPIRDDAIAYARSGGSSGAPPEETLPRHNIKGRLALAKNRGATKRKQTPIRWTNSDGSTTEVPYGDNYERGGKMFFANPDGKGGIKYSTADLDEPKPVPPSQRAPEGSTPEQINEFIDAENDMAKRNAGIAEDRWDEFWVNPETGVPEQMRPDKGDGADSDADFKERISEIRQQLAFKKKDNSLSEPTDKQIQFVLDQEENFLERRKKKLKRIEGEKEGNEREEVQRGFLNDLGRVFSSKSLEEYAKIVNKIKDEYGDNMQFVPEAIVTQLESLAKVLKGNRPVEVPPELEGPLGGGAG